MNEAIHALTPPRGSARRRARWRGQGRPATFFLLALLVSPLLEANQHLLARRVSEAPVVDGKADDAVWASARPIVTPDRVGGMDLTIRAVHTDEEIFLLAEFPDAEENREHKTMLWDDGLEMYRTGPQREDTFVIKWNMEPYPVDLSVSAPRPYRADIWYWKANRSDHAGHADDKMHLYSITRIPRSKKLYSRGGRVFYLHRPGDEGQAAYRTAVHQTYRGDQIPRYVYRQPTGSRADIRAKGVWKDGRWTVEFARKLDTGHVDDVLFERGRRYLFGVSRFEIAGRDVNPMIEEPNFGAGEISEQLWMELE